MGFGATQEVLLSMIVLARGHTGFIATTVVGDVLVDDLHGRYLHSV